MANLTRYELPSDRADNQALSRILRETRAGRLNIVSEITLANGATSTVVKDSAIGPDDPAVVLFTSGSEGRPKGVVLSQGNLLANCAQASARVDYNENDKCFNALPVFHSFGLTGGVMLPIFTGHKTFLFPSPLQVKEIPKLIKETGANVFFGVRYAPK